MNHLQTPQALRQVRALSQAPVSRTYLPRFETGVQILSDEHLQALQDHYVNMGFDFSEIDEEGGVTNKQGRPPGGATQACNEREPSRNCFSGAFSIVRQLQGKSELIYEMSHCKLIRSVDNM